MGSLRVGHDWTTSISLPCIGEGNGNPLQCSYLENPRNRGAWWASVYGVAQSWTRLKRVSSSSSNRQRTLADYSPWVRRRVRHNLATKQQQSQMWFSKMLLQDHRADYWSQWVHAKGQNSSGEGSSWGHVALRLQRVLQTLWDVMSSYFQWWANASKFMDPYSEARWGWKLVIHWLKVELLNSKQHILPFLWSSKSLLCLIFI